MVAVEAGSVQRDYCFEVLRRHGCIITIGSDRVQIEYDTDFDHFAEVWVLSNDQEFISRRHVKRLSDRLNIPFEEFTARDDEQQGRS